MHLTLEIEYDASLTDPESLAMAMNGLLETACSTPGILDDCGNPTLGHFLVAERSPPAPTDTELVAMCLRAAETAENWADCSDMKEALAVFKELGRDCRALVEQGSQPQKAWRYVLYDLDADALVSTTIYDSYREAVDDAAQVNDVIVLPLAMDHLSQNKENPQ
jgi:hypothetical protein